MHESNSRLVTTLALHRKHRSYTVLWSTTNKTL